MDADVLGAAHTCGVLIPSLYMTAEKWREANRSEKTWNPYLRSSQECDRPSHPGCGRRNWPCRGFYHDDETWAIRYLIIDTRNWWRGKKWLISPQWIERVSWIESKVFVTFPARPSSQSPEYTEESLADSGL